MNIAQWRRTVLMQALAPPAIPPQYVSNKLANEVHRNWAAGFLMYAVPASACSRHGCSLSVLCSSGGVGPEFFIQSIVGSSWLLRLTLEREGTLPQVTSDYLHTRKCPGS